MSYRIWSIVGAKRFTQATFKDRSVIRGLKLTLGKSLQEIWPKMEVRVTNKAIPADSFKVGALLVVSRALADTILEFVPSDDVELLPVHVEFKDAPYGEYYFLNVLKRIDAIDRKKSEIKFDEEFPDDDTIDEVVSLVLKDDAIDGSALFQLVCYQWILCVSETLADAIIAKKHSGMKLASPADWTGY